MDVLSAATAQLTNKRSAEDQVGTKYATGGRCGGCSKLGACRRSLSMRARGLRTSHGSRGRAAGGARAFAKGIPDALHREPAGHRRHLRRAVARHPHGAGAGGAVVLVEQLLRGLTSWVRTAQSELMRDYLSGLIQKKSLEVDLAFFDSSDFYDHLHRARMEAANQPVELLEGLGSLLQGSITMAAILAIPDPIRALAAVGAAAEHGSGAVCGGNPCGRSLPSEMATMIETHLRSSCRPIHDRAWRMERMGNSPNDAEFK